MAGTIQEVIGRDALLAAAQTYPSMTDALLEFIDNPFDYRRGRHLTVAVSVDKKRDRVVILDYGGEGMDEVTIRDWIKWGKGHVHLPTDIGQWHVGGKLAAIYLADSLEILGRKAGQTTVTRFFDPHWGSRTDPFEGDLEQLGPSASKPKLASLPQGNGFSMFTLGHLKGHRYEPAILMQRIASVYRSLLKSGDCRILVDGQEVQPLHIPESASYRDRTINIPRTRVAPSVFVQGQIWITDRDRMPAGRGVLVKAGIRTIRNGRLSTEGEWFGHNLSSRLLRLVGEIKIDGVKPNLSKDNWQRSSPGWIELEKLMHEKMQPLVTFLNQLGDSRPATREQRKRGERVRRQLQTALQELRRVMRGADGTGGETDIPAGRRPPTRWPGPPLETEDKPNGGRTRGEITDRTPPPEDAVGRLLRRYGGGLPRPDWADLGQVQRSQWGDGQHNIIVINTAYPLYEEGSDAYTAETMLLHVLSEDEAFRSAPLSRTMEELDSILWMWDKVRKDAELGQ